MSISDEEWEKPRVKRIPQPPTDSELARFDAWKAKWLKICQLGYDAGWLAYGDEPDFVRGPNPAGYDERLETEEERLIRVNSPFARLIEDMLRSFLERPTYAEIMAARFPDPDGNGLVTFPIAQPLRPVLPAAAASVDGAYSYQLEEESTDDTDS